MVDRWQDTARPIVEQIARERALPGAIIAVARGDHAPEYLLIGSDAAGASLSHDTLTPVASITKLGTTLAVLRLADKGMLAIDDPLSRHLPDAAAAVEGVSLRSLLCHTAGLPYDLAPGMVSYAHGLDWPTIASATLATAPVFPPGNRLEYSNLGVGLLAITVERLTGEPFRQALADLVLQPLGIEGYLGDEPPRPVARVAGMLGEHTGTDLEPFNSPFWRSLALGWGGLVTTAAGALTLVRAFAGFPAGFVSTDLLSDATHDQNGGLSGNMVGLFEWPRAAWGLGAELRGDKAAHWTSSSSSPASFGHVGASGCLVWYEPERELAWYMHGLRTFDDWYRHMADIGAAILAATR
jgi:beta-lactamase class C